MEIAKPVSLASKLAEAKQPRECFLVTLGNIADPLPTESRLTLMANLCSLDGVRKALVAP